MSTIFTTNYYLSQKGNVERLMDATDLAYDEILDVVGVFAKHSARAGQLRGEVLVDVQGMHTIRHHFTKEVLWSEV